MLTQDLTIELPAPRSLRLDETALFLDLDGTLAPIAARPQDVAPDPRRTSLLERLAQRLDGRLAVISGRTLADVDRILEGCVTAVAAVHGLVMRGAGGDLSVTPPHADLAAATAAFTDFARQDAGLLVEPKGASVALHYRLAPQYAPAVQDTARALAARSALTLQEGSMVAELRTPGPSKGDSIRAFMSAAPFAGAHPVFVGDDITDEDGFRAVQAMGGLGVRVGPRAATAARFRLDDVETALAWLEAAR